MTVAQITGFEAVVFGAACASVVLAVVAIALSVAFFILSALQTRQSRESSREIGSAVSEIKTLYKLLYTGTFKLVSDSYTTMQERAWPDAIGASEEIAEDIQQRTDEKLAGVKAEFVGELAPILGRLDVSDERHAETAAALDDLLDRAMHSTSSAREAAREESIRDGVLDILERSRLPLSPGQPLTVQDITIGLRATHGGVGVAGELLSMREDGLVSFRGESLSPDSVVTLTVPEKDH